MPERLAHAIPGVCLEHDHGHISAGLSCSITRLFAGRSIGWATKNEWLGLIDIAGLQLEALYGGLAREPLTTTAASTCSSAAGLPGDIP